MLQIYKYFDNFEHIWSAADHWVFDESLADAMSCCPSCRLIFFHILKLNFNSHRSH